VIGVWRTEPSNANMLMGIGDDPPASAAAEQAQNN
jgi:hypothetical protein